MILPNGTKHVQMLLFVQVQNIGKTLVNLAITSVLYPSEIICICYVYNIYLLRVANMILVYYLFTYMVKTCVKFPSLLYIVNVVNLCQMSRINMLYQFWQTMDENSDLDPLRRLRKHVENGAMKLYYYFTQCWKHTLMFKIQNFGKSLISLTFTLDLKSSLFAICTAPICYR